MRLGTFAVPVCLFVWLACGCGRGDVVGPIAPDITLLESELTDLGRLTWAHDDMALAFAASVPLQLERGVFVVHPLVAAPPFRAGAAVELVELATFDAVSDLRFLAAPRGVVAVVDDAGGFADPDCDRYGAVWLELPGSLTPLEPVDDPVLLDCSLVLVADAYGSPGAFTEHPALHVASAAGRVAVGTAAGVALFDLDPPAWRVLGPGLPVAFAPEGDRLVTVEVEGTTTAARRTWRIVEVADGAATQLPLDPAAPVHALRWGPDGIVALVGEGGSWQVHDLTTGVIRTLELPAPHEIHLSPSGRRVAHTRLACRAPGPEGACATYEATLWLIDVATGASALVYRDHVAVANLSISHADDWIAYTSGPRVLLSRVP